MAHLPHAFPSQEDVDDEQMRRYFIEPILQNKHVTFASAMGESPPPIISQEELHAAKYLRPQHPGCGLIKLSENIVVKFGEHIDMSEAETMHLLSCRAPKVPIPKLRNAYSIAGVGYIVMDYVEGRPLSECWASMTKEEKKGVAHQLREYVSVWRTIEGGFFGAVDKGPCKERLFSHVYENTNKMYGPFPTRQKYNRGLVEAFRDSRPSHVQFDSLIESQIMQSDGDRKVLTHGDLHQGNIIIDCEQKVKAIVDWGESCYSVEEMEYCCTQWGCKDDEWEAHIPNFISKDEEGFRFWDNLNNEMRVYVGI